VVAQLGSSEITKRSGFLQENAQINHYPIDQREWTQFIRELARWRNEYEGTVTLTSVDSFATDPDTFACTYYRYGKIVFLIFPNNEFGSDTATFKLQTLPDRILPAVRQHVPFAGLVDNGSSANIIGSCTVGTDGVLQFGMDGNVAGFTGSGNKGFVANNVLAYTLFDAERID